MSRLPVSYHVELVEFFVRETLPARMAFVRGRQEASASSAPRLPHPIGHVHLLLRDDQGRKAFGCAGDYLSVRWLDKRPGRSDALKLRELSALLNRAAEYQLTDPSFDCVFDRWRVGHSRLLAFGREMGQEDLTSNFVSALIERALLDAICRLEDKSLFDLVRADRLGFRPDQVHDELSSIQIAELMASRPATRFGIRHTVGLADPLLQADVNPDVRINDGEPETLEEYLRRDGLEFFKIKVGGQLEEDLDRLARIWSVLAPAHPRGITIDANEAFENPEVLTEFVRRLGEDLPDFFNRVLYLEQPVPRAQTLDSRHAEVIRRLSEVKPIIIDEADSEVDSFKRARRLGYRGTSHKNCKGFFKSLLNFCLVAHWRGQGEEVFLSAEDLMNMPLVPLHQDFVSLGVLGLTQCERNGHHYNYGLSMLSAKEKREVEKWHQDLYVRRDGEWFLNISRGAVECASLQCPGYGVRGEPDWATMTELGKWLECRYPAGD